MAGNQYATDKQHVEEEVLPWAGIAGMMMGPGAVAGAMHGAIHGGLSRDFVSKQMHMNSQMQVGHNLIGDLAKRAGDSRLVPLYQEITRNLARAERAQMRVLGDEKYLRFAQDFAQVPQSWMDALQDRTDVSGNRHVEIPTETIGGKTFEDFEAAVDELYAPIAERLDEGQKKHGVEGFDRRRKTLHPARVSSALTSSVLGRVSSEAVSGVQNVYHELRGGQKGLHGFDEARADIHDALTHLARQDADGIWFDDVDDGAHYLTRESVYPDSKEAGKAGSPMVRKEGDRIIPIDREGRDIKTSAEFDDWLEQEADRFAASASSGQFQSKDRKAQSLSDVGDYSRKLPYLKNAHKATFTDLFADMVSKDMEAAVLLNQGPELKDQIATLHNILSGYARKGSDFKKQAESLMGLIGGEDNVTAGSLLGRAMQQRGTLSMGDGGKVVNTIGAITPLAYKMALSMSPTAAAVQQAQMASMTTAYGAKTAANVGKNILKNAGTDFLNSVGVGKSDLRMPHDVSRTDRTGTISPFNKSSAIGEKSVLDAAGQIAGDVLRRGNEDWLKMTYSDEDLDILHASMLPDGSVDVSDPYVRELTNSITARVLEGVNGLDLPTSKPAVMNNKTAQAGLMFMSTPSVVTKAVVDLYRKGGMLHTGKPLVDNARKAMVTGALASQFASSSFVRQSAMLKAIMLLTSGGWLPAAGIYAADKMGYEDPRERAAQQRAQLLEAAIERLMEGKDDERFVEDLLAVTGTGIAGSIPMPGANANDFTALLAKNVDKRVMGFNDGSRPSDDVIDALGAAGNISPALGVLSGGVNRLKPFMPGTESLDGNPLRSIFLRGVSPLGYFRENSPFLPNEKEWRKQKDFSGSGSAGVETRTQSRTVGRP